jgi:hypothetical protein
MERQMLKYSKFCLLPDRSGPVLNFGESRSVQLVVSHGGVLISREDMRRVYSGCKRV